MWVVKIGGSLERSSTLPVWLEVVTGVGAGQVVVVPGGGSFAEAVRDCDRHWGLPGGISHRMAIVAMEQFGLMLCGLNAGLEPASDEAAMRAIWKKGRTPVWLAASMSLAAESGIEASWRVTSDSLAAWLAGRLGMPLLLVKAAPMPANTTGICALTKAGFLDLGFGDYARDLECEIFCLGPGDHPKFAEALVHGKPPDEPLERF
jgi:aspartokinase-like uncharacterized kinase